LADTEVKELTVMPAGAPSGSIPMTTVTGCATREIRLRIEVGSDAGGVALLHHLPGARRGRG